MARMYARFRERGLIILVDSGTGSTKVSRKARYLGIYAKVWAWSLLYQL